MSDTEVKPKPESAIERRHREMMQSLSGEIPNAVYESKRELVELLCAQEDRSHRFTRDNHAVVMDRLRDILDEEQRFHMQWAEVQKRLEEKNSWLSQMHLTTNIFRLIINGGILVVLVMYLMDMG